MKRPLRGIATKGTIPENFNSFTAKRNKYLTFMNIYSITPFNLKRDKTMDVYMQFMSIGEKVETLIVCTTKYKGCKSTNNKMYL